MTREWWVRGDPFITIVHSPIIHQWTYHYAFRDYCRENHPEADEYLCAKAYTYNKPHNDFDRIMDFKGIYFNYKNSQESTQPLYKMRRIGDYIAYLGVLFALMRVRLNKILVVAFAAITNICLTAV